MIYFSLPNEGKRSPRTGRELKRMGLRPGAADLCVVIGGRAHSLEDIAPQANALVMAWLPGEEGGSGLVDVLCGDIDAGGRLPVSLLRSAGQVSYLQRCV